MSRLENLADNQSELEKIPLKHVKGFFYLSFEHSQGLPRIQKAYFTWLRMQIGRVEYEDFPDGEFREQVYPAIRTRTQDPDRHLPGTDIEKDFDSACKRMREILNLQVQNSEFALKSRFKSELHESVFDLIDNEYKWLVYPGSGRPQKDDPYTSYLVRHVILNEPTGNEDFDAIYSNIKEVLIQKLKEPWPYNEKMKNKFLEIVRVFNKYHPSSQASIDDLLKK